MTIINDGNFIESTKAHVDIELKRSLNHNQENVTKNYGYDQ